MKSKLVLLSSRYAFASSRGVTLHLDKSFTPYRAH